MKFLLVLLFLAACSVPTEYSNGVVVVKNSDGGFVEPVEQHIARMRKLNQKAILNQDYCWSACTMYLSVAKCVGANTQFGFHSASELFLIPNREATVRLSEYYPKGLREWFLSTNASNFNPFGIVPLSGKEIARMTGIKVCEES